MKTSEKLAGKSKFSKKRAQKRTVPYLFINCATDKIVIALFSNGKVVVEKNWQGHLELSDKLLAEIDRLVKKNSFKIESVAVFPGPGSYTGLRVGITTANFLSFALGVPTFEAGASGKIVSLEKDNILPIYFKAAHITTPKH